MRARAAGKKRMPSSLQDSVFLREEHPWVPPTTTMRPFETATAQAAEFQLTVKDAQLTVEDAPSQLEIGLGPREGAGPVKRPQDDPEIADDPMSVLDQELLDRVFDVALKLRRI